MLKKYENLLFAVGFIIMVSLLYFFVLPENKKFMQELEKITKEETQNKKVLFNKGKVLYCHTLTTHDYLIKKDTWELVDDKVVNKNSGIYFELKNCWAKKKDMEEITKK